MLKNCDKMDVGRPHEMLGREMRDTFIDTTMKKTERSSVDWKGYQVNTESPNQISIDFMISVLRVVHCR